MNYTEAVQLAKEGEEIGFNTLYESTYQSKYYLALKYMQNKESAKDVLQDSYIKAFSSLDQLDDPEKFSSWLGIIVANTAKNELKKQNPILFTDVASNSEESYEYLIEDENIQNQPETAFLQKENQELVRELIDSLSAEQRMCILMFHMEGQSIREIADALGCSENTVKSRLNYGRKNIKLKAEELQKKGYKLFTVALLISFLQSEEKALAAQGAFQETGNAMADVIRSSISTTGKKASSEILKRGFLHSSADKMIAAGIGICIMTAGITWALLFAQNKPDTDWEIVKTSNMQEETPTALPEQPATTQEQASETAGSASPGQAATAGAAPQEQPAATAEAAPQEQPAATAGATPPDDNSSPDLFGKLPKQFSFSSGAGGWGTSLHINADGTFYGEYSDSDLGSTGKKYPNGTVYICNFKGKFATPKKVNKYTYSTTIESMELQKKSGKVYYKKGKKYIASDPYGMEGRGKFLIYLPSAPISKLPEDFLSWVFLWDQNKKNLGFYGIYNVSEKQGFSGYK